MSETYYKRKELGLCVLCGGEIEEERKGKVFCESCSKKQALNHKGDYKAYQDLGICPICHRERLYPGEKNCTLCLSKRVHPKDEYQKYCENQKARKRELYAQDKANGMCTRCHKRKAVSGITLCSICRAKRNNYVYKLRYPNKEYNINKRANWVENGKCYFCGEESKDGYKICERHYEIFYNNSHSQKAKEARERMAKHNKRFFVKY